jgi:hypothetical protein
MGAESHTDASILSTYPNREAERRNGISSIFAGILFGLAFTEAVQSVQTAEGDLFRSSLLFLSFFVTALRFLIGAHLHLVSRELVELPGKVWFYDLCIIIAEAVVFVFMGTLCSVGASRRSSLGFASLLTMLYTLDILWVTSHWALAKIWPSWRRPSIPWGWAILNLSLLACMALLALLPGDMYGVGIVGAMALTNVAAFAVDVLLIDHAGLLKN